MQIPNIETTANFLRTVEPFRQLSLDDLGAIVRLCSLRRIPARSIVFSEGDFGENAFVALSGRLALFKRSPVGKDLIVELATVGDLFGVIALIDHRPYPLTCKAQIDSHLLVLPGAAIKPFVAQHPSLQMGLMSVVTTRMSEVQDLARALAHDRIETRIASLLIRLIPHSEFADGVPLSISRQEIADLSGVTLESASRVVKALERQGILDASQIGMITVRDAVSLKRAADAL